MLTIDERKDLRNEILKELYVYHHRECFNKQRETKLNLNDDYDKEIFLAIKYLKDKELIICGNLAIDYNNTTIIYSDITTKGIDYMEEIGVEVFNEDKASEI